MQTIELKENLLDAWINLSTLLKSSRLTQDLTYNEAIVMHIACRECGDDPSGRIPVHEILRQTNMFKSQLNRTVDALFTKGLLRREKDEGDRRALYLRIVPEKLPEFYAVHERSLDMAGRIIDVIGEADAQAFIRASGKLRSADWSIETKQNGDNV